MLESEAWRAIPTLSARRALDRIAIEHQAHASTENGNLRVTYEDFIAYGVRKKSITSSIAVLEALGWIEVVVRGKQSFEEGRYPSSYALTWLPQPVHGKPATNTWRRITSPAIAKVAIKRALERREASRDRSAACGRKGQVRMAKAPMLRAVVNE